MRVKSDIKFDNLIEETKRILNRSRRILSEESGDDELVMGVRDDLDNIVKNDRDDVDVNSDLQSGMTRDLLMKIIRVGNPDFNFDRKFTFEEHGRELEDAIYKSYIKINEVFDQVVEKNYGDKIDKAKKIIYQKSLNLLDKKSELQISGQSSSRVSPIKPSESINKLDEMTLEYFYKNEREINSIFNLSEDLSQDVMASVVAYLRASNVDQDKINKFNQAINLFKTSETFKNIMMNGRNLIDFFMGYEGIAINSNQQSIDSDVKSINLGELIENSNEQMSTEDFVEKVNADSLALDKIKNELRQVLQMKVSVESIENLHKFFESKKKSLEDNILYQHLLNNAKKNVDNLMGQDNVFDNLEDENKKLNNIIQRMLIGNKGYNKITSIDIDNELNSLWDIDLNDSEKLKQIKEKIIWLSQKDGAQDSEFFKELNPFNWGENAKAQLTMRGNEIENLIRTYQQIKKIFMGQMNFPVGYQFLIRDNILHLVLKIDKGIYGAILNQRDNSELIDNWYSSAGVIRKSLFDLGFNLINYNKKIRNHESDTTGLYLVIENILSFDSIDDISNAINLDKIKMINEVFKNNNEIKKNMLQINVNQSLFLSFLKKENAFSSSGEQKLSFVYMQDDEQLSNDITSLFNVNDINALRQKLIKKQKLPDNITFDYNNFKQLMNVFLDVIKDMNNLKKSKSKEEMTHSVGKDQQKVFDDEKSKDNILKRNYQQLVKVK